MNRPFLQTIYTLALVLRPEVITAHQAKHLPFAKQPFEWPKNGMTATITFGSPPCYSFSSEGSLRRLFAKDGSNYKIQIDSAEAEETSN